MLRLSAVVLLTLMLVACETPVAPASASISGVSFARLGDPPPPPEDAEILGTFGTSTLLRTAGPLATEAAAVTGPLEFSLDGRYFVGGGGDNGWLRLSSTTDNVITLSSPRITFRAGGGAEGTGIIKALFDQGSLRIDLATDIAGATFSSTCAANGTPCAIIEIVGADFLDLDGVFSEIDGTLVVLAQVDAP